MNALLRRLARRTLLEEEREPLEATADEESSQTTTEQTELDTPGKGGLSKTRPVPSFEETNFTLFFCNVGNKKDFTLLKAELLAHLQLLSFSSL